MEKKTIGGFQLCILIINTIAVVFLLIILSTKSSSINLRETFAVQKPEWKLVKTTEQQFVRSIARDPVTGKIWKISESAPKEGPGSDLGDGDGWEPFKFSQCCSTIVIAPAI
ncbi:unnamed protein product [Oikopleura dioica]|uniref:Uncharacterized protein n=1 Tax=Oikopleura dioica TaxID=34765 RepID=E4WTP4_OIKDI|nr:unnamed protein product [Oikopleura dioica]